MSLLVIFPYSIRDQVLARANLQWMAEIKVGEKHDIILFPDEDVDCSAELALAKQAFKSAKVNPIDKPTTSKWPISANHVWKRTVDYVDHFKLWPFIYCESDAVFLRKTAIDEIEDEFAKAQAEGKHFMGFLEYAADPERNHQNGVGVYGDIMRHAPSLLSAPTDDDGRNYLAFDWAGKDEVVPKMRISPLFQFQYKKEGDLMKDESLEWLKPEAAVFHTMKDVRFFDCLRAKLNGATPVFNERAAAMPISPAQAVEQTPKASPSRPLSTDIFIKTYDKVAEWHEYAARSIERFCTGFRRTVVVGQQPVEGYQEMQVVKLSADLYTDADFILFTDSDCVFSTPVSPETYMREGQPIWLHRNWTAALKQEGDAVMRWHRGMKKFFGIEPPHEFMCRHPEMVPRWLLVAFRTFCKVRHGVTMEEWILKDHDFADWNMLGMYAWLYHRESFHWINQDEVTPPPITVKQYWGGHESIDKHRDEMERILAGGVTVGHKPPGPVVHSKPPVKRRMKQKRDTRTPERIAADKARMAKARAARVMA